ncbi:MAG: OpgC domain-containing protein [Rhodospirillales bacterium]|jgi:hypothetical protein|nr:OpgC domain-containing protein [Rhodospirillales bacterium]
MSGATPRRRRDGRIDIMRGASLLMIFVDHIGNNLVSSVTLRNFGFSDAAEVFVLLAGLSSMLAYGRIFEEQGLRSGVVRVALRCLQLYAAEVLLLLATFVIVALWAHYFGTEFLGIEPSRPAGLHGIRRAVRFAQLPTFLDILPLYIVLLGSFPLMQALWRLSPAALLLPSLVLWRVAQLYPWLNIDAGPSNDGWFFHPLAWQFLFALGMALAVQHRRGGFSLPRWWPLRAVAVAYLLYALLAVAPWREWGWSTWHPLIVVAPDKSTLDPRRILDVAAVMLLALSSDRFSAVQDHWLLRPLALCGRHSLEVFSAGTLLSLFGRLAFTTFGPGLVAQLLVNAGGFAVMIALAAWLDRRSREKLAHRLAA